MWPFFIILGLRSSGNDRGAQPADAAASSSLAESVAFEFATWIAGYVEWSLHFKCAADHVLPARKTAAPRGGVYDFRGTVFDIPPSTIWTPDEFVAAFNIILNNIRYSPSQCAHPFEPSECVSDYMTIDSAYRDIYSLPPGPAGGPSTFHFVGE